jgi:hypothetical protein
MTFCSKIGANRTAIGGGKFPAPDSRPQVRAVDQWRAPAPLRSQPGSPQHPKPGLQAYFGPRTTPAGRKSAGRPRKKRKCDGLPEAEQCKECRNPKSKQKCIRPPDPGAAAERGALPLMIAELSQHWVGSSSLTSANCTEM